MLLSMWTDYLGELSPEEMVRTFAERGWRTLELSEECAHALLRRGDPARTGEAFRAFAADLGVSFPQGHLTLTTTGQYDPSKDTPWGVDLAPSDDALFAERLAWLPKWIDLFAALGVHAGVYHHGGYHLAEEGWSHERILARRREGIARVAQLARGTGVTVCVENLPGYSPSFDDVRAMAEGIDGVAYCLDTGHASMGGFSCAEFVRSAGAKLRALHVHDNIGERDHILPFGGGAIDWAAFLAALREVGYHGAFNFEIPAECHCPLAVRLAKLDYVRAMGQWMIGGEGT